MRGVSLFSGVGGFDLGMELAGIQVVAQCEVDPWRRRVLAHRFPDTTCFGDVTTLNPDDLPPDIDVVFGGFPCQDLSVAGQRKGLIDGSRSSLFFEFARIIDAVRPRFCLIENVPGLLSSNSGRDFGCLLGTLADIGYGVGWRIIDSRYAGVPQRRRRVFILGVLAGRAGAERASEILSLGKSGGGYLAPRREAGAGAAGPAPGGAARAGESGFVAGRGWTASAEEAADGFLVSAPVTSKWAKGSGGPAGDEAQNLVAEVVGPLQTGESPRGHGHAGVNDQAVADGHVIAVPDEAATLTSSGNAKSLPNRQKEDDVNLVATVSVRMNQTQSWGDPVREGEVETLEGSQGMKQAVTAYHLNPDDKAGGTGALKAVESDVAPPLTSTEGERTTDRGTRIVQSLTPSWLQGILTTHADAEEARPREALRLLREALGEEAASEWEARVATALRPEEVLRSPLHGGCVRVQARDDDAGEGPRSPAGKGDQGDGSVRTLWLDTPSTGASPRPELAKQRLRELGEALSELPPDRARGAVILRSLWRSGEGARVLQPALSALEVVGRSQAGEAQPAHALGVRRLTPVECERLQGFPDNWTAIDGDETPDGRRYAALGDAVTVPVAEWIARRLVEHG